MTSYAVDQLPTPTPDHRASQSAGRPRPGEARGRGEPTPAPAFETLWAQHRPQLARAAQGLTGNRDDAEDLVQETMIRALRGYDRFHPGSNFPGWVMCILYNTHCSAWRRNKLRPGTVSWDDIGECGEGCFHDTLRGNHRAQPEQAVLRHVVDEEVEAALASLPDGFRQVFELAHLGGLSYAEISQALRVPIGTVRSRLSRVRDRLRDQLSGYAVQRGFLRPDELNGPSLREASCAAG